MGTVSVAMQAHMALPVTTLCQCWKITARDGTTIRVIAHTRNLTINGELYTALPIQPVQTEARAGLSVDNTEINAILANNYFTEQDFLAGKWSFARIEMGVVNFLEPPMGFAQRLVGFFGEITTQNGNFTAEVRSLSQLLAQEIGNRTSPHCRVRELGNAKCGVNLATFTHTTTISAVINRRKFTVGTTQADGYFDYGKITFTSGSNLGYSQDIRSSVGNSVELEMAFPFEIKPGDGCVLIAGCDRTRATCRDKFNNTENFDGEPDTPGDRKLLTYPNTEATQ